MFREHPSFRLASDEQATVWRYMPFWAFMLLLEQGALYFPTAAQFEDPFEGSLSHANAGSTPGVYEGKVSDEGLRRFRSFIKEMQRFTLVSCWTIRGEESAAMWRLFTDLTSGIAIKTDVGSLISSITDGNNLELYLGEVQYIDYLTDNIPWNDTLTPFIHKLNEFKHERELRVVAQAIPYRDHVAPLPPGHPADGYEYFKPDLTSPLAEESKLIGVDLSALIHEIVVSPMAPPSFLELVRVLTTRYELEADVRESTLSASPTWGPLDSVPSSLRDLDDAVILRHERNNQLLFWYPDSVAGDSESI